MSTLKPRWAGFTVAVALASGVVVRHIAATESQAQPNQPQVAAQADQRSNYEILAKGIVSSRPFQAQFASAPLRLEFRNMVMGRGETEQIPIPTTILMEL